MRTPLNAVSTIPPDPIRILLAWSEPQATTVWRKLRGLGVSVDVTSVRVHQVGAYLRKPGYYHILHIHTSDWGNFDPQIKTLYANNACLVVLGPEQYFTSGGENPESIVWVNDGKSTDHVLETIFAFHTHLLAGHSLGRCIELSDGCLSYSGLDAIWPQTDKHRIQTTNSLMGGEHDPQVRMMASIGIGQVDIRGDMVYGDKVVFASSGDQVHQGELSAAKIEQHAAGDQVNITRSTSSSLHVSQSAGGEQINVNRLREPGVEPLHRYLDDQMSSNPKQTMHCPHCFVDLHRDETDCPNCGMSLQRSRGE